MITILTVGKKHEDWVVPGIERYQKRLKAPFDVKWDMLAHSSLEGDSARKEESERVRRRLKPGDYVVLLDERGIRLDSPGLASLLQTAVNHSKPIVVVIGGAYGVDDELHQRSDVILSLSAMVFPHQLVRLILIEQIYRAQSITQGQKYHHA